MKEELECSQLYESSDRPSDDWHNWPEQYQEPMKLAIDRAMKERKGARIVRDRSYCELRIGLDRAPWQLSRIITIEYEPSAD